MPVGAKLNEVRLGAVVSVADVTVRVVGKPLPTKNAVSLIVLFPAASAQIPLLSVQVPASLRGGKVMVAEPVADVAGVKLAVADRVWSPDGLVKVTWKKLAPARSSVS